MPVTVPFQAAPRGAQGTERGDDRPGAPRSILGAPPSRTVELRQTPYRTNKGLSGLWEGIVFGEAPAVTSAHDTRVPDARHARELAVARYRAALALVSRARDETIDKLLDAFPCGRGLRSAPARELHDAGCTPAQARKIRDALEFADALYAARVHDRRRSIRDPRRAAEVIRHGCREVRRLEQECFVVIGLDARQRLLETRSVALGSVAQVDVHPREVFRPLIRAGAHSLIIGHCHPSGDAEPSEADVELTRRLVEVGRLVGIPVLDHVIVTDTEHLSMAQVGLLPGS